MITNPDRWGRPSNPEDQIRPYPASPPAPQGDGEIQDDNPFLKYRETFPVTSVAGKTKDVILLIEDIVNLQNVLNTKAPIAHTHPAYLNKDGTVAMLGNLNLNNNNINNIKLPTHPGDAANKSYVDVQLSLKANATHTHPYLLESNYTAADILDKLKTVDGTGSGLDADTVQGYKPTSGATPNTIVQRYSNGVAAIADPLAADHIANKRYVDAQTTAAEILTRLKTVDGSGSGLDADLLGGLEAGVYLPKKLYHATKGVLIKTNITSANNAMFHLEVFGVSYGNSNDPPLQFTASGYNYPTTNAIINYAGITSCAVSEVYAFIYQDKLYFWFQHGRPYQTYYVTVTRQDGFPGNAVTDITDSARPTTGVTRLVTIPLIKSWNESNDGSGSGLDADKLDGLDSINFMQTKTLSGYYGLAPNGNDQTWTRVSKLGLLPYESGTGTQSNIGSNNWAFANGYFRNLRLQTNDTTETVIFQNSDRSTRFSNSHGYIEIGPKNTSYCHIYTGSPVFYFNKEILINGAYASKHGHTHTSSNITDLWPVLYGATVPSSLQPGQIFVKI